MLTYISKERYYYFLLVANLSVNCLFQDQEIDYFKAGSTDAACLNGSFLCLYSEYSEGFTEVEVVPRNIHIFLWRASYGELPMPSGQISVSGLFPG